MTIKNNGARNRIQEVHMVRILSIAVCFSVAAVLLFASFASARPNYHRQIDQRQWNQERRIHQGIALGQLTPWEVAHLKREQARIRLIEAQFMRDGRLSARERAILNHELNRAGLHIFGSRHNIRHW